jgi:hypothetical protein
VPIVPEVWLVPAYSTTIKSDAREAKVAVSVIAAPFAARVLAVTEVGTPTIETMTFSFPCKPCVASVSEVVLTRIRAEGVSEVPFPPTTVKDEVLSEIELVAAADAIGAVTTDRPPKPKAATVTSAMRLKVVFVDICFLSISRTEEFPQFGLNQIALIRFDESHVLIHQIPHRVSGRGRETYLLVYHLHRLRDDGGLA